jgi:hypothetical protein
LVEVDIGPQTGLVATMICVLVRSTRRPPGVSITADAPAGRPVMPPFGAGFMPAGATNEKPFAR